MLHFFMHLMVIWLLIIIFTAKKIKKDKHGHKSSPKGRVKHKNGEVKVFLLIEIKVFYANGFFSKQAINIPYFMSYFQNYTILERVLNLKISIWKT